MFLALNILKEDEKKFLLTNPVDSQEKLDNYPHLPIRFKFDKQRTGFAYLMVSKIKGKYCWVINIKIARKFKTTFKKVELWSTENFSIAKAAALKFFSQVGVDDGENPHIEVYEYTYLYCKFLTNDELKMLPKITEKLLVKDETLVSSLIH